MSTQRRVWPSVVGGIAVFFLAGCGQGVESPSDSVVVVDYEEYCINIEEEMGTTPTQAEIDDCVRDVMNSVKNYEANN